MDLDYAKVIDICLSETTDFKAIVIEIAKVNPALIVACVEDRAWVPEAKRLTAEEGKVAAIKFIRNQTGMSLKESKQIVDGFPILPKGDTPKITMMYDEFDPIPDRYK